MIQILKNSMEDFKLRSNRRKYFSGAGLQEFLEKIFLEN
jgi:hypothetical protein